MFDYLTADDRVPKDPQTSTISVGITETPPKEEENWQRRVSTTEKTITKE
jgi:hypothetical protein